ncbi:MAG: phospho-N-acetylmuramoyl-pentapeptide-transferase [Clostridia bacterium]|nr:phospho-N-acetylmuramoyl-pentapeptide-transferase [Clostridia bacterium]
MLIEFVLTLVGVFVLTVIAARIIIPILKSHKMGQVILDIGPRWHKSKEGTPTMGGICFILAMLVALAVVAVYTAFSGDTSELIPLALTLCLAVFNGIIGFVDDYCKLVKKKNEGLKAYQKFLLQLVAAGAYIYIMIVTGHINTALHIPFTDISLELGWGYYVLAILIITGVVNSVNLTDGIDGLASSVVFVIGAFFAVVAFYLHFPALSLASASLIGGTLGFLVYNFHPARVFMGDTGSLFLGGMIAGMAFMLDEPLIIILAGIVCIMETLSVMLQVGYFKLTHGKRLFKMAPLHHHFEKCGWSENKVVLIFSLITLVGCVLAWFGLY